MLNIYLSIIMTTAKYINITYDKTLPLSKRLNEYYFIAPYFETKSYPSSINMEHDLDDYSSISDEMSKLRIIKLVTAWDVFIINALRDGTRNRYVAFQPRNIKEFEKQKYRLYHNKSNIMNVLYDQTNKQDTFKMLDTIYGKDDHILFRGADILNNESNQDTFVDFNAPYIFTDSNEQKTLMKDCWFYELSDDVNESRGGYRNMVRKEYPFITGYFIKICIFKYSNKEDEKYLVGYGCMLEGEKLSKMNDSLKEYCQCFNCTASSWNPIKYVVKSQVCLKKMNDFWDSPFHKKTLRAYYEKNNIQKQQNLNNVVVSN